MAETTPYWQAHDAAGYDRLMGERCAALLDEIKTNPSRRTSILANPQDLHRELFADFTPPSYPEYAGTYRGAVGTMLEGRTSIAESELVPGESYRFVAAAEVDGRMTALLSETASIAADPDPQIYGRLLGLAYTFAWFGKVHPFLDGNGHVQRAIFAAMATEFGYPLSRRFAIHPRPYDRLLATALEIFTTAPPGQELGKLPLVAEYLAFFLGGPFDTARSNVGSASPYQTADTENRACRTNG